MVNKLVLLISIAILPQSGVIDITWKDLQQVSFEESFLKEFNDWFLVPTFEESIMELNGKTISIKGYVIPLDLDGKEYALSAYPFSSCFFCGGAGPESVMTLNFSDGAPKKYKTDEVDRFRGKLTLNKVNPEEFIYVLESPIQLDL